MLDLVAPGTSPSLASGDRCLALMRRALDAPACVTRFGSKLDGASASELTTLAELADEAISIRSEQAVQEGRFTRVAFERAIDAQRAAIARGSSFFARLGGRYRRASSELATWLKVPLPKAAAGRLAWIDGLASFRARLSDFGVREKSARGALGETWEGWSTDFEALASACQWFAGHRTNDIEIPIKAVLGLAGKREHYGPAMSDWATLLERGNTLLDDLKRELTLDDERLFDGGECRSVPLQTLGGTVARWREYRESYSGWVRLSGSQRPIA